MTTFLLTLTYIMEKKIISNMILLIIKKDDKPFNEKQVNLLHFLSKY